jgi:phosphoribosylformylglycinamidine synthase subunit PurQ / glutaminase
MKCAVIRFPGSNCDQDCYYALRDVFGAETEYVWHKESSLEGFDLIVLPGGFSYGDYLRCGAIARFSPVMRSVAREAERGKLVLGICNGFQILCESRLLPGALIRNQSLHFICEHRWVRVENTQSPFTCASRPGALLRLPIAHGEGNYRADEGTLRDLNANGQVLLRYVDEKGATSPGANPNGSMENIAGICNRRRNVFGLMPHPERACDPLLGSEDGRAIFESVLESVNRARVA